jgi:hypothetical protein
VPRPQSGDGILLLGAIAGCVNWRSIPVKVRIGPLCTAPVGRHEALDGSRSPGREDSTDIRPPLVVIALADELKLRAQSLGHLPDGTPRPNNNTERVRRGRVVVFAITILPAAAEASRPANYQD